MLHRIHGKHALILSLILIGLLVFTMGMPWYFQSYSGQGCSFTMLIGWSTAYCRSSTGCCPEGGSFSWKGGSPRLADVYNSTLAMLLMSFFASVGSSVLFFLRMRGKEEHHKIRLIHLGLNIAAVGLLLLAIIIFGAGSPAAAKKDAGGCSGTGPCSSFFGSQGGASWGGAGWIVAILFALPLDAFVGFLSTRHFEHEHRDRLLG